MALLACGVLGVQLGLVGPCFSFFSEQSIKQHWEWSRILTVREGGWEVASNYRKARAKLITTENTSLGICDTDIVLIDISMYFFNTFKQIHHVTVHKNIQTRVHTVVCTSAEFCNWYRNDLDHIASARTKGKLEKSGLGNRDWTLYFFQFHQQNLDTWQTRC